MRFLLPLLTILIFVNNSIAQSPFGPAQFEKLKTATFIDTEGNEFQLSKYKGKVILVDFWETWCGPCIRNMPVLNKIAEENGEKLIVIAINSLIKDDKKAFEKYVLKNQNKIKYAVSPNLAKELHIYYIPYKVLIDAEGNFVEASDAAEESKEDEEKKVKEMLEKLIPQKKVKKDKELQMPKW